MEKGPVGGWTGAAAMGGSGATACVAAESVRVGGAVEAHAVSARAAAAIVNTRARWFATTLDLQFAIAHLGGRTSRADASQSTISPA